MAGGAFRTGHQLQQVISVRFHPNHPEITGGQGSSFVKYEGIHPGQIFQGDAALGDHARLAHRAHSGEVGQGHGDDQRAGAAHHQEIQSPVDPGGKIKPGEQGRQEGQGQGRIDHAGGVHLGKPGDQALGLGTALTGGVHQLQNSRHGGGFKGALRPDGQHTGQIDAARQHPIPLGQIGRNGLTGDFGGIHGGRALDDHAVHRDPLAGIHPEQITGLHILGVGFLPLPIDQDPCHIRTQIHQGGHGFPGALHGDGFKELTDLEEQHHRRRFHKFSQAQGADRGHRHQKVLVKGLLRPDLLQGIGQHLPARRQPCADHQHLPGQGDNIAADQSQNEQRKPDPDPPGHFSLLLIHLTMVQSFS